MLFLGLPEGLRNASMQEWMEQPLAVPANTYSEGCMTYDLRRHGLIQRILNNHSSQVTDWGSASAYASPRCTVASCIRACPNRSTAAKASNRPVAMAMRRLGLTCAGLFNKAIPESDKIGTTSVTWDLPRDSRETLIKAILGFNQLAPREARLPGRSIFNGLQPSKMAGHPCPAREAL